MTIKDTPFTMTITQQMDADGSYPSISDASPTTSITLNFDTKGVAEKADSYLLVYMPDGFEPDGADIPGAPVDSWHYTDKGTFAEIDVLSDGVVWTSCVLNINMDVEFQGPYNTQLTIPVEFYNPDDPITPVATCQAGMFAEPPASAVDPSKISLKGFYLDPNNSTVGGTRNIFNTGAMCAKVYLGFSYAAPSGDTSTVADVAKWLGDNGALWTESGNQEANGKPSDYGWTVKGNTDPNNGAYVYDNQVLVPANVEDQSNIPGNLIWHLEFYLQPDKDETQAINIYYQATYTDSTETTKTISTINDTLLTLDLQIWNFSPDNFTLHEFWNGDDDESYSSVYALEYNPATTPISDANNFYEIYAIEKDWIATSDDVNSRDFYWPLWDQDKGGSGRPIDASVLYNNSGEVFFKGMFTLVYGKNNSDIGQSVITLIAPGINQNFSQLNNSSFEDAFFVSNDSLANESLPQVNYDDSRKCFTYQQTNDAAFFLGITDTHFDANNAYGPLVMYQGGLSGWPGVWATCTEYIDDPSSKVSGTTTGFTNFLFGIPGKTSKQKCTDSFGKTFYVDIAWSSDSDTNSSYMPQYWSVSGIIPE